MTTALDTYKYHYGMNDKPDGAVVLKHTRYYGFFDYKNAKYLKVKTLEEIGINPFMTRKEIIECLQKQIEINIEQPLALSRMAIEKIIDFCVHDNDDFKSVNSSTMLNGK